MINTGLLSSIQLSEIDSSVLSSLIIKLCSAESVVERKISFPLTKISISPLGKLDRAKISKEYTPSLAFLSTPSQSSFIKIQLFDSPMGANLPIFT